MDNPIKPDVIDVIKVFDSIWGSGMFLLEHGACFFLILQEGIIF
jgi:hypothetical protein